MLDRNRALGEKNEIFHSSLLLFCFLPNLSPFKERGSFPVSNFSPALHGRSECRTRSVSEKKAKQQEKKERESRSTMPRLRPPREQLHPGNCACCLSSTPSSSLQQTLSELDHSRSAAAAAASGDLPRLLWIIERDPRAAAAPPRGSNDGFTALHHAARRGCVRSVAALLEVGADPNALTTAGKASPLHRAAFAGHLEVCGMLLRAGAEARKGDGDGETPAFKAASQVCGFFFLCFSKKCSSFAEDDTMKLARATGKNPAR